jgi:hypothetical protein
VKAFLEFELTNGDHTGFARCAKEALDSHWSQAGAELQDATVRVG